MALLQASWSTAPVTENVLLCTETHQVTQGCSKLPYQPQQIAAKLTGNSTCLRMVGETQQKFMNVVKVCLCCSFLTVTEVGITQCRSTLSYTIKVTMKILPTCSNRQQIPISVFLFIIPLPNRSHWGWQPPCLQRQACGNLSSVWQGAHRRNIFIFLVLPC